MSSKHPQVGDLVKVVASSKMELIDTEGRVTDYESVDWQSKAKIQPNEGKSFWAWTWDVLVIEKKGGPAVPFGPSENLVNAKGILY